MSLYNSRISENIEHTRNTTIEDGHNNAQYIGDGRDPSKEEIARGTRQRGNKGPPETSVLQVGSKHSASNANKQKY